MNDINTSHLHIIGRLAGTFGLAGEMRVILFDIDPDFLVKNSVPLTLQVGNKILTPIKWRTIAKAVAMRFAEIPDVNTAETFPKSPLLVSTSLLPIADDNDDAEDIIDFVIRDAQGIEFGVVTAIYNFGASDIIDMTTKDDKVIMIPLLESLVIEIDFEKKCLIVSSDIKKFLD